MRVQEVAVRDGFQIEPAFLPTDPKLTLIALAAISYAGGIDLDKLLACTRVPTIVGHETPGQIAKVGTITDLHQPPPHQR